MFSLDRFLGSDCLNNRIESFVKDESVKVVSTRKLTFAALVLCNTSHQVIRDAGLQRHRAIRQDVDVELIARAVAFPLIRHSEPRRGRRISSYVT